MITIIIKGKFRRITGREAPEGEVVLYLYSSFHLCSWCGWGISPTSRPLYPRERPGTNCTEGWVGPRAGLHGCWKSRPPPGFDPLTVHRVARNNNNSMDNDSGQSDAHDDSENFSFRCDRVEVRCIADLSILVASLFEGVSPISLPRQSMWDLSWKN